MAFPATHAKRDAIVLQASRGFASAPSSPRVFLQPGGGSGRRTDLIQLIRHADKPGCPNIEGMVQRICSLFPTAREYDVRELLIKYHYREAVVVSALQVLKYPLTMPGPASTVHTTVTPPTRHLPSYYVPPAQQHAWSETMSDGRTSKLGGTFSTASNTPMHSPSPNRPNHSPKIKLKYLKSVFPKAEETFLLDLLVCSDNNVNQVTQQLLTLGHEKKDKPQPLTPRRSLMTPTPSVVLHEPVEASPKKLPTLVEMLSIKSELQKLFPQEEDAVIQLALESTDFDLEKAKLIMSSSQEREESFSTIKSLPLSGIKHTVTLSSLKSSPSVMSTFKDIANLYSPMKELSPDDEGYRCKPTTQPIAESDSLHYNGPNPLLLSTSYVTPNGPQHEMVNGPNHSLRSTRDTISSYRTPTTQRVTVKGPDSNNRSGPKVATKASLSSFISQKFKRESMRRI